MTMEKRGVISDETPNYDHSHPCGARGVAGPPGEPQTKEAADQMESHTLTDLTDAVAEQTCRNKQSR